MKPVILPWYGLLGVDCCGTTGGAAGVSVGTGPSSVGALVSSMLSGSAGPTATSVLAPSAALGSWYGFVKKVEIEGFLVLGFSSVLSLKFVKG